MPILGHHPPVTSVWAAVRAFQLSFWVFMEASLHRHDWLYLWPLVINSTFSLSPLPGGQRLEVRGQSWKFLLSRHVVGSPGNQPPHPRLQLEPPAISIQKDTYPLGESMVFSPGTVCQEAGAETNTHFLLYNVTGRLMQFSKEGKRDLSKITPTLAITFKLWFKFKYQHDENIVLANVHVKYWHILMGSSTFKMKLFLWFSSWKLFGKSGQHTAQIMRSTGRSVTFQPGWAAESDVRRFGFCFLFICYWKSSCIEI